MILKLIWLFKGNIYLHAKFHIEPKQIKVNLLCHKCLVAFELRKQGARHCLHVDLHDVLDWHLEAACLALHVPNVDTALVVEQDNVLVALGVDTYVGLFLLFVCQKRLDDELPQFASSFSNLKMLET